MSTSYVLAQETVVCSTDSYHELMLMEEDYYSRQRVFEDEIYRISKLGENTSKNNNLHRVPVVFHLICRPGSEPGDFYAGNPDDNTVYEMFLDNLNNAFRNTGAFDQGVGADMEIEFCIAAIDTNNNPSTGITRFETELADSCGLYTNSYYTDVVKQSTSWNPESYLNIWIVANLVDASGFATYPWFPRSFRDGVIIDISYLSTNYMAGVMLAHEVGHYLGLYHVFHGACINNDCLSDGDKVCDTPPSSQDGFVITCVDNTCSSDIDDLSENNPFTSDVNDNLRTYMNYGFPNCINQFTEGQKNRARICLENFREELINSIACESPVNKKESNKNKEFVYFDKFDNTIRIEFVETGDYFVEIYSIEGKICSKQNFYNSQSVAIKLNELDKSIYFVRAYRPYEDKFFVKKVLVF